MICQLQTFLYGKSCYSPESVYTPAFLICLKAHFSPIYNWAFLSCWPKQEEGWSSMLSFLFFIYVESRFHALALGKSILFTIHGSTQSLAARVVFSILSHIQRQQTGSCWLCPLPKSEADGKPWQGQMVFTAAQKEDLSGVEANRKTVALCREEATLYMFLSIIAFISARFREKLM